MPFVKGQSGNPAGRPPRGIKGLLRDLSKQGIKGTSASELQELCLCIMNAPEEKVRYVRDDEEQPMLARLVAAAILDKKSIPALEIIMDRAFGRTVQRSNVDITSKGQEVRLTLEQGAALMKKINEEC